MARRIVPHLVLPSDGFERLADEARAEGYRFIDRLSTEWENGGNRFAKPGEALYVVTDDSGLIAVGGINRDPYASSPETGRLRHFYVRTVHRRKGIGSSLLAAIIEAAAPVFARIHLRTDNPGAARLYERNGFVAIDAPHVTHVLANPATATKAAAPIRETQWTA
jgi:GNAT superfamily N-acetyltransferase